jgi:hypothetical protein
MLLHLMFGLLEFGSGFQAKGSLSVSMYSMHVSLMVWFRPLHPLLLLSAPHARS